MCIRFIRYLQTCVWFMEKTKLNCHTFIESVLGPCVQNFTFIILNFLLAACRTTSFCNIIFMKTKTKTLEKNKTFKTARKTKTIKLHLQSNLGITITVRSNSQKVRTKNVPFLSHKWSLYYISVHGYDKDTALTSNHGQSLDVRYNWVWL